MGSQALPASDTGERAPPLPQSDRPVLDLPTPEGWKAEFDLRSSFLKFCVDNQVDSKAYKMQYNRATGIRLPVVNGSN